MENRSFVVVMRGSSSARFKPNDKIEIEEYPTSSGPALLVFRTRYEDLGFEVDVPLGLWVDIRGESTDVYTAAQHFGNPARLFAAMIGVAANAAIEVLQPEIVFDNTPGVKKRRFFQSFIPDQRFSLPCPRVINAEATTAFIQALDKSTEIGRISRAIVQYGHALSNWRFGDEILPLAHLFMGMETLKDVALRRELDREGIEKDKLAQRWDVSEEDLLGEVRRRILFNDDDDCLRKAKRASDAFEHGFLPFVEIRELSMGALVPTANYVRKAIFELAGLDDAYQEILLSAPYDDPVGPLGVSRYYWGSLESKTDDLAPEGQAYPRVIWKTQIKSMKIDEEGNPTISSDDEISPMLADGVVLKVDRVEVWDDSGLRKKKTKLEHKK